MIQINQKNNDSNIKSKITSFYDYLTMVFDICDYIYANKANLSKEEQLSLSVFNVVIQKNRAYVFFNHEKFVSIYFPFGFSLIDDRFYLKKYPIDTKRISHLRTIMDSIKDEGSFLEGMKTCNDGVSSTAPDFVSDEDKNVFSEICMLESGYLRFDHDPKNANGRFHPLNHLDINFSKDATYKIGLYKKLKPAIFLQMLNDSGKRYYIEHPSLLGRLKRFFAE